MARRLHTNLATPTRLWLGSIAFLAGLGSLGGCRGGSLDVTITRGVNTYHFTESDCAVSYTGRALDGTPSSIDIACPPNLVPKVGRAALHVSVPLSLQTPTVLLKDERFASIDPGYVPGAFVVVAVNDAGNLVSCDPREATGSVTYAALPRPGESDRFAGHFSADASLASCTDAIGPAKLTGDFEVFADD